jgi:arylformamidase
MDGLRWQTFAGIGLYLMKIYDISVPLSSATPTYPGDPQIEINPWKDFANGDSVNVSAAHLGLHTGTHVDAPAHFIEGGTKVDALPLQSLIGEAEVVEVAEHIDVIDENFVTANCIRGSQRVLFKTRNSNFWTHPEEGFRVDYTYLDPAAATLLVELGIKLVGIDYLSVERFGAEKHETHHILLRNDVVILEGLDLREVTAGLYELICLPLRIAGGKGDGSPARTILRSLI